MGQIDIQTVIILLFFGNFISLILFLFHPGGQSRDRIDYFFISSRVTQCLAWFFIAFYGRIFYWMPFNIGSVLLSAGFAFEAVSMTFIRLPFSVGVYRGVILIPVLAAVNMLNPAGLGINEITGIESILFAFPFLLSGIVISRWWSLSSLLQKMIALIYLFCAVLLLARSVFFLVPSGDEPAVPFAMHVMTFFLFFIVLMTGSAGYIFLKKEVTEQNLLKETMTDYLTGIPNRRGFESDAEKYLSLAGRSSFPVSLLMIDLDNFSRINRRYGHATGDVLLKELALSVRKILRSYDLLCRFGGEEFAVLLPNASPDIAHYVAERVRSHVNDTVIAGCYGISCSVSIGISSRNPDENLSIESMYDESEEALHRAKRSGKNRVCHLKKN